METKTDKAVTGARTAARKLRHHIYRGCLILERNDKFGFGFLVHDLDGNRVTDLPTLRRAKNSVDCIIDG